MLRCCRHPFLILVNFIATLVTAISLGLVFRNVGVDTPGIQNRSGWAAAAQLHEGLCHGHSYGCATQCLRPEQQLAMSECRCCQADTLTDSFSRQRVQMPPGQDPHMAKLDLMYWHAEASM